MAAAQEFQHELIRVSGTGGDLDQLVAITPTLIIGLGGTGKGVVMSLRRQFYERYGVTRFPMIGHLVIDSDDPNKPDDLGGPVASVMQRDLELNDRGTPPEFVKCMLGTAGYKKYFEKQPDANPHVFEWITQQMMQFGPDVVKQGCGTHRPFGRLSFFHHFKAIKAAITNHIGAIRTAAAAAPAGEGWAPPGTDATTDPTRLEVIIVHSIAGGTGAGMFIDLNYLVKRILEDYDTESHVCDIAVLPGMLESKFKTEHGREWNKVKANAYACLMEMEHYSMRRWDKYAFLGGGGKQINPTTDLGGVNNFKATWDPTDSQYGRIDKSGAPWDTCYLIDNRNQAYEGHLDPPEVFEMIAEYLMLDFEPTAFGARKRSFRSNAAANYLTNDYVEHVPNPDRPVYSNIYSCRFSTFGLSQIYYDRDRMRRAMAYGLAERLIRRLAVVRTSDSDIDRQAERDLTQPPATAPNAQLIVTPQEMLKWVVMSDLEAAGATYQRLIEEGPRTETKLRETNAENLDRIRLYDANLETAGPVTNSVTDKSGQLRGEIAKQIDHFVRACFQSRGAEPTRRLLQTYCARLKKADKKLQGYEKSVPKSEEALLAGLREVEAQTKKRLDEVESLFFGKKKAREIVQKEAQGRRRAAFDKAVNDCWNDLVKVAYRSRAAEILRGEIANLIKGIEEKTAKRYKAYHDALTQLADFLRTKFDEAKVASAADRNISLWEPTEDDYKRMIEERLPQTSGQAPKVNWQEAIANVFTGLQKNTKYMNYTDPLSAMNQLVPRSSVVSKQMIEGLGDAIARVCYEVISAKKDGFNAVDSLLDPRRQQSFVSRSLRILCQRSDAYLPREKDSPAEGIAANPRELSVSSNEENKARLTELLQDEQGMNIDTPLTGEPESIVLYQEVTGLPLFLYRKLDDLAAGYENVDASYCHIDYQKTKLHLPDIQGVDPVVYRRINMNAEKILFGIMIKSIVVGEEDNIFYLRSKIGVEERELPLSSSLDRMIKEIAKDPKRLKEVEKAMERWFLQADQDPETKKAQKAATMLVGVQKLMETTEEAIQVKGAMAALANPIYFCAGRNRDTLRARLISTNVGRNYLLHYDTDSPRMEDDNVKETIRRCRADCFDKAHIDFPIPVHNGTWVPEVALPEGGSVSKAEITWIE